ncbi:hypothetical protein TSTA_110440 [Talaromyces stipitatus ATCC 10500]|uniref:Zn(2)-C6 fungal-type domain-containing protein n=1 Tax=Talaromyces stipitatus (strain ATCC 10500 / CBS 375.48 / QM 6759 / NRRL 1006) TaxID=441959 RepID=B8MUU4_TALSN|nr:uncharacterized protein TSTA_110440 [Talaromyces stipitatus ATCC 10500]EED11864.1 hypothetical protein TSTA_110440 [Talaromyces stipitatus ATCC 10500]
MSTPQRYRAACEACRYSKVRCSGGMVCDRCSERNFQCSYGIAHRAGKPKGSKKKVTLRLEAARRRIGKPSGESTLNTSGPSSQAYTVFTGHDCNHAFPSSNSSAYPLPIPIEKETDMGSYNTPLDYKNDVSPVIERNLHSSGDYQSTASNIPPYSSTLDRRSYIDGLKAYPQQNYGLYQDPSFIPWYFMTSFRPPEATPGAQEGGTYLFPIYPPHMLDDIFPS